jgi:hypothetical protein
MSTKLDSIYQSMRSLYQCRLLAAKSGLDHIVSWVHVIEDFSTISEFLRPGELVITSGSCYTGVDWLFNLIDSLQKYRACGLCIILGKYISAIPAEIVEYCEQLHFPFFTFPWELYVVDLIQTCAAQIINSNRADDSIASAFQHCIFSPENASQDRSVLKKFNYDPDMEYQVILMKNGEISEMDAEMEFAIRNITSRILPLCSIFFREDLLILISKRTRKSTYQDMIDEILLSFDKSRETIFHVGIGSVASGVGQLPASYKKALTALRFSSYNKISPVFYDSMGLNRLFYSLNDFTVISDIYQNQLGALEEYDKQHDTDYVNTLYLYLKYNESVQKVADETFTHRNTVNYRISKIKSILNSDFDTMDDRFPYEVAFYCRDIIKNAGCFSSFSDHTRSVNDSDKLHKSPDESM